MSQRASYDFTGRVALVTGAAGGFGGAITARLREAGATVIGWDLAGTPEAPPVDVTSEESVDAAAAALISAHGRLDILVNNAGIVGTLATAWETPVAEFRRLLEVNLVGAVLVCRALMPLMIDTAARGNAGRIVNIASIQAKEGMALAAGYSAAKAGLLALTKSMGKELAGTGVLCNAITPAASLTPMSSGAPKARLDDILSRIPMGRFLEPDEVAAMTLWLASEDCSFSTGAVFDLSGGRASY
ncbi:SDR family oxidoreductase [Arsenicitalea aurantiaca]|uniref:SDR family oxidoreductase n=1 Tax=Arsenicitalea aurantiaca TaxID=1783274 RepID=A0A433X5D6_9HYPH|nr:SDR family NAD(P)-dependent oxidoreductase [Arsenicitalea aurantiaca]RUT29258.1 SDR family oxidoreductase [Arsenicitalea aurantiaca]